MKKIGKWCGVFLCLGSMFMIGFFCFGKIGVLEKKREIQRFTELNNARNSDEKNYGKELTEEDAEFIQEHVLGQWRFSERIMTVSGENISEQGVEEMKTLTVTYDKDFVRIDGYDQATFSEPEDIYFYNQCGGNNAVNFPVYHVRRHVNENSIPISNDGFQIEGVAFPLKYELVSVFYTLGYDEESYPSVICPHGYAAGLMYINPYDTDTIYLSFCGLWELKRVQCEK